MQSKLIFAFTWTLLIFGFGDSCVINIAAQHVANPPASTANVDEAKEKVKRAGPEGDLKSAELTTANFADVAARTYQEIAAHGATNVLLVVDIDNTILAMDQPLGSDQWYNWQYDFIFRNVESEFRVAKDLDELLRIQGILFALGKMHPPEPSQPQLIKAIQKGRCSTIVLTSRGPEFRNATERELKRNGYDFTDSALEIIEPTRGRFLPYDKTRPNANGLSGKELASLRDPRPISYSAGIMMTAGQHKGYMLRTLLARSRRNFKAIVFADDHSKHTKRVTEAFAGSAITTACFHYIREQPNVDAFNEADKQPIANKWNELNDSIKAAFEGS